MPTEAGGYDGELNDNLVFAEAVLRRHGDEQLADAVFEARKRLNAVVLPGWVCSCGTFTGDVKERHSACRKCGLARR